MCIYMSMYIHIYPINNHWALYEMMNNCGFWIIVGSHRPCSDHFWQQRTAGILEPLLGPSAMWRGGWLSAHR